MARIGGGKLNLHPCTEADQEYNLQVIEQTFVTINEQLEGGAVDNFTVKQNAADSAPSFFENHFSNVGVEFDAELHQDVYAVTVDNGGVLQTRLFTAIGSGGGGDTHRVKRDADDTSPQFLADTYDETNFAETNTYDPTTHFPIIVSPSGTNDLQHYAPYAIIKLNEDDGLPDMLYAKFADHGNFIAEEHTPVFFENLGSTLRAFIPDADLQDAIQFGLRGVVTMAVTAATGPRGGPRTPGTGQVRVFTAPTGPAGTAWTAGSIITVENWVPSVVAVGKAVGLRPSRIHEDDIIWEVDYESCSLVPES